LRGAKRYECSVFALWTPRKGNKGQKECPWEEDPKQKRKVIPERLWVPRQRPKKIPQMLTHEKAWAELRVANKDVGVPREDEQQKTSNSLDTEEPFGGGLQRLTLNQGRP
jgi:hypothetical protein